MSCEREQDVFRCHDRWDLFRQIMALLPPGRAWQTHEDIFVKDGKDMTPLQQYWFSFAIILEYLMQEACALTDEFFCHSADKSIEKWNIEWGIPTECSPFTKACEKMRWQGLGDCAYFTALAWEMGWKIRCSNCLTYPPVAGCMMTGMTQLCSEQDCDNLIMFIEIITEESPAFIDSSLPMAGIMMAGCTPLCGVNIHEVECMLERFAPADLDLVYEIV